MSLYSRLEPACVCCTRIRASVSRTSTLSRTRTAFCQPLSTFVFSLIQRLYVITPLGYIALMYLLRFGVGSTH